MTNTEIWYQILKISLDEQTQAKADLYMLDNSLKMHSKI